MSFSLRRFRDPALFTVMAVIAAGCGGRDKTRADTGAAATTPAQAAAPTAVAAGPDPDHAIALGALYTYPDSLTPEPTTVNIKKHKNQGVAKGSEPTTIVIARAESVPGRIYPLEEEILALIYSDRPYHGLGIGRGDNYLWRNKTTGEVWVVSKQTKDTTMLERDTIPYIHQNPEVRRLVIQDFVGLNAAGVSTAKVAYGFCLDDPVCNGHCGFSQ